MANELNTIKGYVLVELFDAQGNLKEEQRIHNLITDAGDLYYATRGAEQVLPGGPAEGTALKVTGMKLGTGTAAVHKAAINVGSALGTYKTGSNVLFDATYPQVSNLGSLPGVQIVYKTTFNPGVATDTALTECVIVNDAGTPGTSTAANTISRLLFASAINKGASDTLAVTWNHKFLGS